MATVTWRQSMLYQSEWIPVATTSRYVTQIVDESNTALSLTQISTAEFSIYNSSVNPPVLLVGPKDIKNVSANGGAISSSGMLTLTVAREDNFLVDEENPYEKRRWVIEWTYTTGSKTQRLIIDRIVTATE